MPTDTKTALLDFAERSVRMRGIDGFSYRDLAELVGIRKASIHYHFPTKANLSEALMDRYHERFTEVCANIDDTYETGGERLSALIDFYRGALNEAQTLCLCVAFIGSRESLSDTLQSKIAAFRSMVVDWITSTFERAHADNSIHNAAEPRREAFSTIALLEGAHLAAHAAKDVSVFDQALSLLRERLEVQS